MDPGAYGVKQFYQWWPCYTAFGQGGVNDGVVEAYFTTKKAGAVFDVLDALEQRILAEPEYMGTARGSRINRSVLLYYGVDTPDSLMLYAMYALVGVVLAIVMVGALSLVQSAFSISLAERTRTLGMLASVGATRRQKRQSVFFEAAVLGAIGIPAGLAAGCMGIGVTLYLLDGTVRGLLGMAEPLRLAVRPGYLLAAAAFSALTLLLSAWLPAVRASRVSPVDAMRGAGQVKLTAKHLRTRPITRKLFGFEGVLALKNAKRNRSRYRSILFSLTLSVVLLVSVSGFSSYMRAAMDMRYDTRQNWQYTAELTGEFSGWPSGIIARLEGLEGAGDDSDVLVHLQPGDLQVATVDLPTGVQAELKRQAEWQHSSFPEHYPSPEPGVSSTLSPTLLVLEDELFAEWAGPAVQLDSSRLSCVLAGQVVYRAYDGRFYEFTHNTPLQPGDSLPLVQEGVKENLYIAAASQKAAPLVPQLVYELGKFYVVTNQTVFRQFCARAQQAGQGVRFSVLVGYPAPSDKEALQKNVSQVAHELTGYESLIYGEAMHDTDLLSTLSRLMEVFLYGFVALIGLVCAANIFNTVTTGIALRGREYAMLKSVGITPKKFRHMVRLESLFYALKALAYGLPISLLILWGEYRAIRINFFFRFTLPWVGILLAGTLALTVTGASAFYAQRQLGRTSIVDTLKTELC